MFVRCASTLLAVGILAAIGCDPDDGTMKTKVANTRPNQAKKSTDLAPATADVAPSAKSENENAPTKAEANKKPIQVASISPAPVPTPKTDDQSAAPIELSGKGDQASSKFQLQSGLSTWKITHDGTSNVQISLLNSEGKYIDMPLNEIGRYSGKQIVRIGKPGEYLLNVKADGKWTVTIDQPRPSTAPAKPLTASGKGTNITPFVTLPKGLCVFKMNHRGDGVFRVKLFNAEGRLIDQIVGVIGAYEGSKAFTIDEEGIYIIGVSANGDWSVNVE